MVESLKGEVVDLNYELESIKLESSSGKKEWNPLNTGLFRAVCMT